MFFLKLFEVWMMAIILIAFPQGWNCDSNVTKVNILDNSTVKNVEAPNEVSKQYEKKAICAYCCIIKN
jgi:hypothetical protein